MLNITHNVIIDNTERYYRYKQNIDIYNNYYKQYFRSPSEMLYYYKNPQKAQTERYCRTCGKENKFLGINLGYNKYCSIKCSANNEKEKEIRRQTCLRKYNVDNYAKTKECQEKMKHTCIERFGVDNIFKDKERIKQACIKKYGVDNIRKYPKAIEQFKQKKLTNIDENGLNSYQRGTIKQRQVCLKKYGVDNYSKTKEYQEKCYRTLKKNMTFNSSKQEDLVYEKLLKKFSKEDIIRQYHSKEYPFNCDFYIKSLKLYIECHFYVSHYYEPFDCTKEEHLKELEKLKQKVEEVNFKGEKKRLYSRIIKFGLSQTLKNYKHLSKINLTIRYFIQ